MDNVECFLSRDGKHCFHATAWTSSTFKNATEHQRCCWCNASKDEEILPAHGPHYYEDKPVARFRG